MITPPPFLISLLLIFCPVLTTSPFLVSDPGYSSGEYSGKQGADRQSEPDQGKQCPDPGVTAGITQAASIPGPGTVCLAPMHRLE